MEGSKKYMVEFEVFYSPESDFEKKIPEQRNAISTLFQKGKLLAYSLSMERTKLWGVFLVDSESELVAILDKLPLTPFMDYDYSELTFHNGVNLFPTMSLN